MSTNNEAEVDLDAFFSKKDKRKPKVVTTEELFEKQRHAAKKSKKKTKQAEEEQRNAQSAFTQRTDEDEEWIDGSAQQNANQYDEKKYENLKVKMVSTAEDLDDEQAKKVAAARAEEEAAENERRGGASCWRVPVSAPDAAAATPATQTSEGEETARRESESPKRDMASSQASPKDDVSKSPAKEPPKDDGAAKKNAYVPPHLRNKASAPAATAAPASAAAPAAAPPAAGGGWRERMALKEKDPEARQLEPVRMGELRRGRQNAAPDVQNAEEFPALNLGAMKKEVNALAAGASAAAGAQDSGKKGPRRGRERTISLSEFNKQNQADAEGEENDGERWNGDESDENAEQ